MEVFMKSIRRGVFETNSSSTHSLTICAKEDYVAWRKGEVLFDKNKNTFITKNDVLKKIKERLNEDFPKDDILQYYGYFTYKQWQERETELESFEQEYTTKNGEVIKVFGEFGFNG
jgi:predicted solute-binding protein